MEVRNRYATRYLCIIADPDLRENPGQLGRCEPPVLPSAGVQGIPKAQARPFQGSEIDKVADLRRGEEGAQLVGHDFLSGVDANARDDGLVGENLGGAFPHEVDDHRLAAAP